MNPAYIMVIIALGFFLIGISREVKHTIKNRKEKKIIQQCITTYEVRYLVDSLLQSLV